MLAAILESGDPNRLYTGLSLLVATAVEGEPARGLVSFGALPVLAAGGHEPALQALVDTVAEAGVELYACAAAVEATGTDAGLAVRSTPRFLADARDARLVVV